MPRISDDMLTLKELDSRYPESDGRNKSRRCQTASKFRNKRLGKFGAASKVRIIDPASVDVSKYLQDSKQ